MAKKRKKISAASSEGSNTGEKLTSHQWRKISELFYSAVELEPEQRAEFLDRACGNDTELRRRVETLIAADEEIHTREQ